MLRTTASHFLALTLVLVAIGCEAPAADLAPTPADLVPEQSLDSVALERALGSGGVLELEAPHGATRVGALISLDSPGVDAPRIEARGVDADGTRGEWQTLETTWREGGLLVAVVDLSELAFGAELRVAPGHVPRIALLTWSAAIPIPRQTAPQTQGTVGASRQPLTAELAALGVVSRET